MATLNLARCLRTRAVRKGLLKKLFLLLLSLSVVISCCVHWYHVYIQRPSPMDYLPSNLLTPFYRFKCPSMSDMKNCKMPNLIMISTRPLHLRFWEFLSWMAQPRLMGKFIFINTTTISIEFGKKYSDCIEEFFPNRLFFVYKQVFKKVLTDYPQDR